MKLFPLLMISALFALAACDPGSNHGFINDQELDAQQIIGGNELGKNDARRFYVAKLEIKRGKSENICTATQITNTLLLTAAHCFFDDTGNLVKSSAIRVAYSSDSWRSHSRTVKSVHLHPDYPGKDSNADLAIVKIYGLAPDSQTLLPVSFEKPQDDMFSLTSIGYGITNLKRFGDNDGQGLGTLRTVQTFSIGYTDQDRSIIITQKSGKGINGGDSGGPAIYSVEGKPTVIGVARSVTPRKEGRARVFDVRGTYTSTYAFKNWIISTITAQNEF